MNILSQRFTGEEKEKMWQDKYCHFWYNAPEIFQWTQEDFDRKAKEMKEAGITVISTVGVTHFRWNYIPFWPKIVETIAKGVKAFHKYGIKFVEHHSSCLIYHPQNEAQWDRIERYFQVHFSKMEDFPGYRESLIDDPEIEPGLRLSSLFQVDGKTGKPVNTWYAGHALCFNNPDYNRIYFSHLEAIAKTGLDCINPDDVIYYGGDQACTCKHCRKLFKEETGYDIPDPENWDDFFEHYEKEEFIAWLKFKQRSTDAFQTRVSEKLKEWGLEVYRPCYHSCALAPNRYASTFINSRRYWSHIYQENAMMEIIRYSWPRFYMESLNLYAMARELGVPSMSMFYPRSYAQYFFAWALCQSWGHIPYLGPQGFSMTNEDKFFNDFEKKYSSIFINQQKVPDLTFLVPRASMDYTSTMLEKTYYPVFGLFPTAHFASLQADAINEYEEQEQFNKQKCIVSIGATLVSEELAEKLLAYLRQGGHLIIFGDFAIFKTPEKVKEILAHKNVKRFPWEYGRNCYQETAVTAKYAAKLEAKAPPFMVDFLRNCPGELLRKELPYPPVVKSFPAGHHVDIFRQNTKANHRTLHFLDMRDLFVPEGTIVTHDDPLIHYEKDAERNPEELLITLRYKNISSAILCSPNTPETVLTVTREESGESTIHIPPGLFAGYAAVDLTLEE